ncbi:MAG: NFYB/HAP3 family transcription factor subunit [Candidatus Absconditabacterales bacterium]|nr:NFYB/HAP3 family transcription factor subunit [Candidatus Absconditabacterales bacterium]
MDPREDKPKRRRKKNYDTFDSYIKKVLKQVHPDLRISKDAVDVLNSILKDLFNNIANEARILEKNVKRVTMSTRDIQSAVRLVLKGELSKHAVSEGTKAVAKYQIYKGEQ